MTITFIVVSNMRKKYSIILAILVVLPGAFVAKGSQLKNRTYIHLTFDDGPLRGSQNIDTC